MTMLTRRHLLLTGAAFGAAAGLTHPRMAFATAATDRRLFLIVQRGGADGLFTAAPLGDSGFAQQRGQWAKLYEGGRKLDSVFTLHPALKNFGALYGAGEALVAHAIATDYRDRSHFDAQNLLETGGISAYQMRDGWLNRFLGLVPEGQPQALALAAAVPLVLRGDNPVKSYAPTALRDASAELIARVESLYVGDEDLHALWASANQVRAAAGDTEMSNLRDAALTGELAARMMREGTGARIAMLDLPGWDSHAGQPGQVEKRLGHLDALLGSFHTAIGRAWKDTLVMVVTEFGRTVAINGTVGTDHGTGGAALLLGGAVKGRRVVADWPGLGQSQLLQGRDLKPTGSLEALIAGAVAEHFGVEPGKAMRTLFPGRGQRPVEGLIRA